MANAVNAEYKKIEGIHVLADFEYRKYVRSTPVLACETCGKRQKDDGVEIKRCQACIRVGFCSKECQRQFWPQHKQSCKGLEVTLLIEELVHNFCEDAFLLHFLRAALIFKLGLLPRKKSSNRASTPESIACDAVHLHMTPISSADQADLIFRESDAPLGNQKIPGYLAIGINSKEPAEHMPITFSPQNQDHALSLRLYRQARAEADKNGRKDNPIHLIRFGYDTESLVFAIEITPDAFETATGNIAEGIIPPVMKDADIKLPIALSSCLHLIWEYVEKDTENRLKLRRDLRPVDKIFTHRQGRHALFGEGEPVFRGV